MRCDAMRCDAMRCSSNECSRLQSPMQNVRIWRIVENFGGLKVESWNSEGLVTDGPPSLPILTIRKTDMVVNTYVWCDCGVLRQRHLGLVPGILQGPDVKFSIVLRNGHNYPMLRLFIGENAAHYMVTVETNNRQPSYNIYIYYWHHPTYYYYKYPWLVIFSQQHSISTCINASLLIVYLSFGISSFFWVRQGCWVRIFFKSAYYTYY